jgi:hypothetical protein
VATPVEQRAVANSDRGRVRATSPGPPRGARNTHRRTKPHAASRTGSCNQRQPAVLGAATRRRSDGSQSLIGSSSAAVSGPRASGRRLGRGMASFAEDLALPAVRGGNAGNGVAALVQQRAVANRDSGRVRVTSREPPLGARNGQLRRRPRPCRPYSVLRLAPCQPCSVLRRAPRAAVIGRCDQRPASRARCCDQRRRSDGSQSLIGSSSAAVRS